MPSEDPDEQRGRDLVRAASAQVRAPRGLRAGLEPLRRDARRRRRTRALTIALGGALAAAAAVVLALALPGDVPDRPTVAGAAALAERPATRPPPGPAGPRRLSAAVEGVAFPDWGDVRWPPTGMRTDRIDDRAVTTVFYVRAGRTVSYQIVAGDPLPPPVATRQEMVGDTVYRTFRAGERTVVTWVRGGRTCIVSGRGVRAEILRRLATWEATT